MLLETVHHSLALAVRVEDHFTALPVSEPLRVELETAERGVPARAGNGLRHDDGTYRWVNLAGGARHIHVSSPTGQWVAWESAPLVTLPLTDRSAPVVIHVWPTSQASVSSGMTAIRGTLIGVGIGAGQRVEIEAVQTPPRGRFARTDSLGEFLFPLPGWLELDDGEDDDPDKKGLVELAVVVPGRTVTQVEIVVGSNATTSAGSTFFVPPGRETRARIHLS
jgi:hypothetical protein